METPKHVLITDLDNTLFDWVYVWARSFSAMINSVSDETEIPVSQLHKEARAIHQRVGTSEYAFLLGEMPSLTPFLEEEEKASIVFSKAIEAFRHERRRHLRLYPGVIETFTRVKESGAVIVGYTESFAYYTSYRVRKLKLDGLIDVLYSPKDHDIPKRISLEAERFYPDDQYSFKHTVHKYTPARSFKPDATVLNHILSECEVDPRQAVYVGDSLFKDIAMARSCGVLDVWAKYGEAQDSTDYGLLKEVTHWTDEDVTREAEIRSKKVEASITLESEISQIFEHVAFSNA